MNSSIAFVFPGQGSQHLGMLSELAELYPQVLQQFDIVSDRVGYDVWQMTQDGPLARLNQTEYTQVAMLTADVAVYSLVEPLLGIKPSMMAGHSLGEYAALVCAGAISLPDAAELVAHRGRLMQETVPLGQGAMAVIVGLQMEDVHALCLQASQGGEQVTAANYNTLSQLVIAGHTPAVERAITLAESSGASMAQIIPVSVPCHCGLLKTAAERYDEYLQAAEFMQPETPVLSNVDLSIYASPTQIKKLLKEQLYSPVQWVGTIQTIKNMGIDLLVECGPRKVLTGLIKRIDNTLKPMSVHSPSSMELLLKQVREIKKEDGLL